MKFQVTSATVYNGGEHADEGAVIDVSPDEAAKLAAAGRGYPVKDAPPAPAATGKKAK